MKGIVRDVLVTVLIAAVVYLGLRTAVQSFRVEGPSMLPNFHTGEWVLVNKLAYKFRQPQRGQVIIFHEPAVGNTDLIKRVIGFPGETVDMINGVVYIHETDGKVISLKEPYISYPDTRSYTGQVIPPGEYFVLGDNRPVSEDSRYGWFVLKKDIIGEAWLVTWPPGNWGAAPNFHPTTQPAS